MLCSGTTTEHGADGDGRPTSGENGTSRLRRHKEHVYDSERTCHYIRQEETNYGKYCEET